jgi:hypothetical protein
VKARPSAGATPITPKKPEVTPEAATRSGSSPPSVALPAVKSASDSKASASAFQSAKSATDRLLCVMPFEGLTPSNEMMRSAPGYGSGRRSTALTTEKMAVFEPTPRASTSAAQAVNPGLRHSMRQP